MSQQVADELVAKFAKVFEDSKETFKKFNEQLNELLKQQTKLLADRQRKTLAEKRVIREMWADKTMLDKVSKWLKENVKVFQKEDIGDFILANLRKNMME